MNNKPLLTIAIPTYNRCEYLKRLLISIIPQVESYSNEIEVIVCDNASTDDTKNTACALLKNITNSQYYRNESNVGMDGNFLRCRQLANGEFFWMIGDDDFVLPDGISAVIDVLKENPSLNLVYVNSTVENVAQIKNSPAEYMNSAEQFVSRIGIMITFISGIISRNDNTHFKNDNDVSQKIMGMFLMHLSWQFLALKNGNSFAIINNNIIKATPDNSGGYRIFSVFAQNLSQILDLFFARDGHISKKIRRSSMFFLLNFIGRPEKQKNHKKESPIAACDAAFDDLPIYKYVTRYAYKYPFIAGCYCEFKDVAKKVLKLARR
ncbi:glycosyltransferase family A protein [Cedecea neteri]|uniref:glycosyltransferase family 2 protein n=1 Tax=Cedecea neteri TaxID=158822 RepID=UPI002892F6F9|nr:glycosyltransferase family A protein [Cedecea neteri]WNJ81165.1 glycosyltransferase family A protein [Cedecea neteri]